MMPPLPILSANMRAFLSTIAISEGVKGIGDDGYNVIVGSTPTRPILFPVLPGSSLPDYRTHPRRKIWLPKLKIFSTAAGRYQIRAGIFDAYRARLGLKDFGHDAQDALALQLIRECHAQDAIESGQIERAIFLCRSRWASFPGSGYGQHQHDIATLLDAFKQQGGSVALA